MGLLLALAASFTLSVVTDVGTARAATVPDLPSGHTELLRATLIVQDLGSSQFGCINQFSGVKCSDTGVLSKDDFAYAGSREVIALRLTSTGGVLLTVSPAFAASLRSEVRNGVRLHLGDESLSSAPNLTSDHTLEWRGTDVSWTDGDTVHVLLSTSAGAPNAPTLGTPTAGDGSVALGWTAGANNDSAITKHQVCVKTDSTACADDDWEDIPNSASATSHTVTGLPNGTEHHFRVRAVNALGPGDASGAQSATPEGVVPTLPAGHTELLRATLTVQDLGSGNLGCANSDDSSKKCSNSSVLTDDDFAYDGNRDVTAV